MPKISLKTSADKLVTNEMGRFSGQEHNNRTTIDVVLIDFNPLLTQSTPSDIATMGGARSPMTMKNEIRQPIVNPIILYIYNKKH